MEGGAIQLYEVSVCVSIAWAELLQKLFVHTVCFSIFDLLPNHTVLLHLLILFFFESYILLCSHSASYNSTVAHYGYVG